MQAERPKIRITVNGQPAVTVDLAAEDHNLSHDAMRKVIDRNGIAPIPGANLGRMPLFPARAITRAMTDRPGRTGRPRIRPAD